MIVYIDVLIVINIYITYFVLRSAARLLHTAVSFPRTAAASVFGGFTSLCALVDADIAVSLTIKIGLTVVTVLIAFGFGSAGLLMLRSFVCAAAGMLICGAAVMIREFTGSSFIFSANGYVYMNISALVLVISSAVIYGILSLVRRMTDTPLGDPRVRLTVTCADGTAELDAIADSGNYLRDRISGKPVIICRADALGEAAPKSIRSYLRGNIDDMTGIRLIPVHTVSGSTIAAAFRPSRITVRSESGSKTLDALIAVMDDPFAGDDFDAVIGAKLLK